MPVGHASDYFSFVFSRGNCATSQQPSWTQQHSAKMSVVNPFLESPYAMVTSKAFMTCRGRCIFLFLMLFEVKRYALQTTSLVCIAGLHRIADSPHLRYHTVFLDLSNVGGLPQEARHLRPLIPAEIISPSRSKIRSPSLRNILFFLQTLRDSDPFHILLSA